MKYAFHNNQFTETELSPGKIAIAGSDRDIDWQTLQLKVMQLADVFSEAGVPSGHPVIIYGHKEHFFPLAILACMHTNTTYIPIDTIYPEDRIRTIIEATGSQVIINCTDKFPDLDMPVVIDFNLQLTINRQPDFSNAVYGNASDPLQYIIFTSGSTGEPKGVRITRESIRTFIDWSTEAFGFDGSDVFMNQAPFTFDVSLCDILNAFTHGGTLVLNATELIKDQDRFLDRLIRYKCSVWTSTPSFAYLFLRHERFTASILPSMKTFLFMGEELPNRTCGILRKLFPEARLLNAYGPTEGTIVTTLIEITDEVIASYPMLPIGYPMAGSELFIEKANHEDKEGELVLSGDHVSIGYFKNEDLNKEKFFLHKGKRAFRTGDLAYFENDLLFCIGRNDDQVKMHGFRIELNEISAVLCRHEAISDAVTVALKRGNEVKKLISFVITQEDPETVRESLIAFLEKAVPYYMVPGDISFVSAFPYSASHKIDKKQLIADYLERQLG